MEARATEQRARARPGPVIAWSILALLQVAAGLITFASREEVEDTNPLFDVEFVLTSVVVYSILILFTVGITVGYSLDVNRTLGFQRFHRRWLGAGAGVIVFAFVLGAVMTTFGDAADEQGLAPDRWEPGK